MLNRFKIGTRMAGIMVMTVLGMALVAAFGLMSLKENRIEDRRAELQHLVQSARGIVEHYHQEATAGRMKEPDAQSAALAALSSIEFGANDYVFVYQYDGTTRSVGKNKKGLGENRLGMVDSDGVPMIRKLIEAAQRGGGYVTYRFPRAGETVPNPKLSYADGFAPWQWMVGTGVYIDDIEEAFQADLLKVGGISLVLILLIGGGMVLVSFGITRPLAQITGAMGELASGNTAIEVTHTSDKDEIGQLARALQTFKDNALEMERMRVEQEEAKRRAEAER
jgi:methyl-accepting chemotaxis protein